MEAVLQSHGVPYNAPSSPDFGSLLESWSGLPDDRKPNVIVLPESAEHVAAAVKESVALKQAVVVRGGGHDTFRRWNVDGATLIDLRNLNRVTVDAAAQTANVSGGATSLQVLRVLKEHGFHTPTGGCATVGYTSWACVGGMGHLMSSYGLGSDQILGAKVVNAKGDLVDADETLLKGLRGGGGSLGVVVQLTVKIYPINDIQAGMLVLDSTDIRAAVTTFYTALDRMTAEYGARIPRKLHLQPATVIEMPGLGRVSCVAVIWNGPADDEFREWTTRVAALAPLMPGTPDPLTAVATTTSHDFLAFLDTIVLKKAMGRCHTVSVTGFTPDVIAALAEAAAASPADGLLGGIYMHVVRADNPSCSGNVPDSVLPYRRPHIMLELLGFGKDPEAGKVAAQWALDTRNRLAGFDETMKNTYLPLTAPEFLDLENVYGDDLAVLKKIKAEVDPDNIFRHTVPKLF
ncbi:hypothetical protein PWT90_06468 [Aphanocladium album]|nr:hypothetical protein PWT90_06468 [Aphanocladium album]